VKRWITKAVLAAALVLCLTRCTHLAGAVLETRDDTYALGGFLATDLGEHVETSLVYLHNMRPEVSGITMQSVGLDFVLKYPFYFANNHFSIFPMAGVEGRYIISFTDIIEKTLSDVDLSGEGILEGKLPEVNLQEGDWLGGNFGFGVKFGVGMDVSFTPSLFLRTSVLYQPESTTFMNGSSGLRFNASIGYRAKNDAVRKRLTQAIEARRIEQEEENREENLIRATVFKANDPQAFYELALYYIDKGKNVPASAAMEKALALDPAFRYTPANESFYSPQEAAVLGIETEDNFTFGNEYSLYHLLGCVYLNAANGTGDDRDRTVDAADKRRTIENALTAFRRGYDIDIKDGENRDVNLKAVYLGLTGITLDLLGREDEATDMYIVLSGTTTVTDDMALRVAGSAF